MRYGRARVASLALLAGVCFAAAPVAAQTLAKLDPLLQQRVSLLGGQSRIVATAPDAGSASAVALLIQQLGGTVTSPLGIINGCAATVPNASLSTLAASDAVEHLALDRLIVGAMERTGPTVGATLVRQQLGLDGAGVGVAVIDSGVTPAHDDLADPATSSQRIDRFVDLVNHETAPYDDYGHGTHVAGIIAGNGADSSGARSGIAPAATLTVLKVLDSSGQGQISDVIAALDYVVAHRFELNIRVVNLSVATGVYESYDQDPLTRAARKVVDAGIVVVASAGNAGRNQQGQTQYGGITAPGDAPWVLTVGASSHMGTADRSDDAMAPFSSRGPTAIDRAAKPDLVAPGVGIESLSAPGSTFYNTLSAYLLAGTVSTPYLPYLSLSGTSQAAPVVTGTVALMLQANPALTPNEVKAVLQFTAQTYPGYDALTEGAGFLNAAGAVQLARYLSAPDTIPYPDSTGWSQTVTWGNQRVGGGRLTGDASAWPVGTEWGAISSGGEPTTWGMRCVSACDNEFAAQWQSWGIACADAGCDAADWSGTGSENVVWGSSCGGSDCGSDVTWTPSDSAAVMWNGNDASGSGVWGTTVVWGTSCFDPSCEPVIWPSQ